MNVSELKYHPIRFRHTRAYLKELLGFYISSVGNGIPSSSVFSQLLDRFVPIYNNFLDPIPFVQRPIGVSTLDHEFSLFVHYASFHANGRNIFDLDAQLVEMFMHTDVEAIPITTIQLPYSVFYIYFGTNLGLTLYDGHYYVDGAYINTSESLFQIVLSTSIPTLSYTQSYDWITNPDRYFYFSFQDYAREDTVGEAIEKTLATERPFEKHELDISKATAELQDLSGIRIHIIHNQTAQQQANENKESFPVFRESLKIIFNALCYITAYRNDIEARFAENAPQKVVEEYDNAMTPKQKRKVTSRLASMGFTRINFCGSKYSAQALRSGREVEPHWRRGHWRNQPYGTARSEHKLIWIMPTIVRKDKGTPSLGHIYDVDEEDT